MNKIILSALATAVLIVGVSATAACGGSSSDNGGSAKTATPAAGKTTASTPAAGKTTASTPAGNGENGGGNTLTLVAKNTLWDKNELKAKPGEVTIIVDNQDPGIVHNVHVYKGEDNTGEDMGMSDLEAGPSQQTLKLTLEAADYFYVCDAHPATMEGKLDVE